MRDRTKATDKVYFFSRSEVKSMQIRTRFSAVVSPTIFSPEGRASRHPYNLMTEDRPNWGAYRSSAIALR